MPSPGTISRHPMLLDKLEVFGESELNRLIRQRRVFNRLDWWSPHEWLHSDAFCVVSSATNASAAMLTIPVSFDEIDALRTSRSTAAWLRWCAVADGVSAADALRTLTSYLSRRLLEAGIHFTYCIMEPDHWLYPYLSEAGFVRDDEVVTMIRRGASIVARPMDYGLVTIRQAVSADIEAVCTVDTSAFEEQWQYPAFVLRRALLASTYFTVAERDRQVIGYQFATCYDGDAHITRLAVRSDYQGRGIGSELLTDSLYRLQGDWGATTITLNTQLSNQVSQRLYTRFGFEAQQPSLRVLRSHYPA